MRDIPDVMQQLRWQTHVQAGDDSGDRTRKLVMHPTLHLLFMDAERDYRAVLAEREQQIARAMPSPRLIHRDFFQTWASELSRVRRTLGGKQAPGSNTLTPPAHPVAFAGR